MKPLLKWKRAEMDDFHVVYTAGDYKVIGYTDAVQLNRAGVVRRTRWECWRGDILISEGNRKADEQGNAEYNAQQRRAGAV